jgi:SAM-dependent methyltransferase
MAIERLESLEQTVERVLVCPSCYSHLVVAGRSIQCLNKGCTFESMLVDGVAVFDDRSQVSFFDDRHELMEQSNAGEGVRSVFYEPQAEYLRQIIRPGMVVLDAGCGPALSYLRESDWFLIGLDPSYASVRANSQVDLRIFGKAARLPLPNQSVDAIICFYSIHHMVGNSVIENRASVLATLREFARVLKPEGHLVIFEVNPWPLFAVIQRVAWNLARRFLGPELDMYFYSSGALRSLGATAIPTARHRQLVFRSPPFEWFPPVFSIPWLRIPRFMYPFAVSAHHWTT